MTAATTTPPTYGPGRDNNGLPGARGAGILLSTPGSLCGLPRALIFCQAFRFSSSVIGVIKNEKMPNHPWNRVLFWWWRSSAVPQSRQNGPRVVLWTIQIKRPLCSWIVAFAAGVDPQSLHTSGCPSWPAGVALATTGAGNGTPRVGADEGDDAFIGGTPTPSDWAVRRAASAAA